MKTFIKICSIFIVALVTLNGNAQGDNCLDAEPFCTGNLYTFPAGVSSGVAESGNNYGCLGSQPNPAWYYMEIDQGGNLSINIENYNAAGSSFDVDFILYGPYPDYNTAMSYCGNMGTGTSASGTNMVIDCSFDPQNFEVADISNAQPGEVYVLLITNFSNQPTNIQFTNTGSSTATTDCSIVIPCSVSGLNGTIEPCDPATNTYEINGSVTIADPPDAGDLIAEDCQGNQVVIASAPFTPGNYNFTIPDVDSDGQNCFVNVFFSDLNSCSDALAFVSPPPCTPNCLVTAFSVNVELNGCDPQWEVSGSVNYSEPPLTGDLVVEDCDGNQFVVASAPFPAGPLDYNFMGPMAAQTAFDCQFTVYFTDEVSCSNDLTVNIPASNPADEAGTFTVDMTGNGLNQYILCVGDQVTITSDGNWSIPPLAPFNDPSPIYLLYSCPPQPGGVGIDPVLDPCFEGYIDQENIVLTNVDGNSGVTNLTDNVFYVVPFTLASLSDLTYWQDCYDLAIDQMTTVQFLNPITFDIDTDCQNGAVTIENIEGGYPEFFGGNFTASNLLPTSASLDQYTTAHGGSFQITGLSDGDSYSFDIIDENGCPQQVSGVFTGPEDASFSYDQDEYCANDVIPSPTITGVQGGTFSSQPGLTIDAATGDIDAVNSVTGTYTVTYQSPDPECYSTEEFEITIHALPNVSANPDMSICAGAEITLNGEGASAYVWDNGVQNGVSFAPTGTMTYTVIGTDANGCENSAQVQVTVYDYPTANFSADPQSGTPPLIVSVTNETTGEVTAWDWNFGNGNTSDEVGPYFDQIYDEVGNPTIVLIAYNEMCSDTMALTLNVQYADLEYNIPNVFTANNDGANDVFHLSLVNASELDMTITNRWGNLMARITDVNGGWDGTTPSGDPAAEGVYFFVYTIKGLNGEEVSGHGFLQLIRD